MKWSANLKTLGRGFRLAAKVARSELALARSVYRAGAAARPKGRAGKARPATPADDTPREQNPGGLRMLSHVPATPIRPGAPLVVVLHGCGQQAVSFAEDSGWVSLADRLGFPLLLPEQAEDNNRGRCFRWFMPSHTGRGKGEAASIVNMVRTSVSTCGTDPKRVYVVGLSAGGAMAAALLAAYPDVFAGGAVVDGLPVGVASSSVQALMRMASAGPDRSPAAWADLARSAAPRGFKGRWPRLSVWVGEGDTTVAPENGLQLAAQWRALHGCAEVPVSDVEEAGIRCRRWSARSGVPVELWTLAGAAHGYPIGEGAGHEAAYVHRSRVAATVQIAAFWGLPGAA